jgi:hypothetical protein
VLQPNVAIFSTGPSYDKHIEDLLDSSMKDVDPKHIKKGVDPEHLKVKEIEGLPCLAFRTYHFQYYSNQNFKQVVDYICGRLQRQ